MYWSPSVSISSPPASVKSASVLQSLSYPSHTSASPGSR